MAQEARIIFFNTDTIQDAEYDISDLLGRGWEIVAVIPHSGIPVDQDNRTDPNVRQTPGGFVIMVDKTSL